MIVDTSAIVATVLDEPHSEQLGELLVDATAPKMSAATAVQLSAVLTVTTEVGHCWPTVPG